MIEPFLAKMNKTLFLFGTVLLAVSLLLSVAEGQNSRRPTYDLNVRKPIEAIITSFNAFLDNLHLWKIWLLIGAIAPCLSGLLPLQRGGTSEIPEFILKTLHSSNSTYKWDLAYQPLLAAKLSEISVKDIHKNIKFEGYCSTPDFETIHNFVWKEDDEFSDLLSFLHRFGFSDIYDIIKGLYVSNGCPQKLIDELPTAPPRINKLQRKNNKANPSNVRGQVLKQMNSPKQNDPKCEIAKIIELLPQTGLIELLQFLSTVYKEFSSNPSTHFLIGKIQEPAKGNSVRKFKSLQAIKDILANIHEQLKKDPFWGPIFELIKKETGIDFGKYNPVDLILSIVISILWPLS